MLPVWVLEQFNPKGAQDPIPFLEVLNNTLLEDAGEQTICFYPQPKILGQTWILRVWLVMGISDGYPWECQTRPQWSKPLGVPGPVSTRETNG